MKDELRSKFLLLLACGLLLSFTACGFKPVYAQHEKSELSQIYVAEIPKREGQVLRNKLQDMLASNGNEYRLEAALTKEIRQYGIQEDLRVSRYDIVLTGDFVLISNLSGKVILQDKAKVYSSYNRTDSEFSTFVAEEDALEKASEEVAFEIRNKLVTFFAD